MQFVTLLIGAFCLNLFAYLTIKLRPGLFGVKIYRPMLWNFKLSVLPAGILLANIAVFMALSMVGAYAGVGFLAIPARVLFCAGLLVWLLFLPNSGYLITELNLNHRGVDDREVPIWYDIILTLSFALSGIVNTLLNIVILQVSFLVIFDPRELAAADYAALFLSGLGIVLLIVAGIYMGREVRVNSWDVLRPLSLAEKLKGHFSGRGAFRRFALYVVFNVVFFMIMYVAFGLPFYFLG